MNTLLLDPVSRAILAAWLQDKNRPKEVAPLRWLQYRKALLVGLRFDDLSEMVDVLGPIILDLLGMELNRRLYRTRILTGSQKALLDAIAWNIAKDAGRAQITYDDQILAVDVYLLQIEEQRRKHWDRQLHFDNVIHLTYP
jgi:hypothetical protein